MNFASRSGTTYGPELWNDALRELISQKVLAVHAERDTTIKVTPDQVAQALERRIESMSQQVGGIAQLESAFGKTITQIKADLRPEFRAQLQAQRFRSRKLEAIEITPSEVKVFFEKIPNDSIPELPDMVRVSHIVRYPKASEAARQEVIERLSAVRDSIVHGGADFEEMARRFSEDPGSAASGGRIQGVALDALVPEFAAVAARLEQGAISQVFQTTYGYHILRVNERSGGVADFNHILISVDEGEIDPEAAIDYLDAVSDSLESTEISFETMASRHSEENFSASQGGQVVNQQTGRYTLTLDALGSSWVETIQSLEEGEVSGPVKVELVDGRAAYHIVRLDAFIPAHTLSLETDYNRIRQIALQVKQQEVFLEWLDGLRDDVYVDVKVDSNDVSLAQF